MKTVLQAIRILVIILLIDKVRCQDGFNDQDLLRLQQLANDGQIETITSYSTNIIQRDPNSQSISSMSVQYQTSDDEKNQDYNRADRGRSKKVYRIKNPFQRQVDDDQQQQDNNTPQQDNNAGASNQYASMQYSLPPDEFLQQMRAEQFYQQHLSTQLPNMGYTATPQPQYQMSTHSPSFFDNNSQQSNQMQQLDPKVSNSQSFLSNSNSFQYNNPSFNVDNIQSTPSPNNPFLSSSLSNSQYVATQSNPYVSSSSSLYVSSPQNIQSYVSSPLSAGQTGTPDFSSKITTTIGSNSLGFENNDLSKKIQLDHFDNSANGMRYPYQNELSTSTVSSVSPFSDTLRDNWQNALNTGVNSLSKSLQEVSLSHYQNSQFNSNQQDGRLDSNIENINDDTHRIGNLPSANNMYMNFAQPDYQVLNNIRSRTRDLEHETGQPENVYSHGDFGWKLNNNKKPLLGQDSYSSGSFSRQSLDLPSDTSPVSQMSFHMDSGRPHNYEQISKSAADNLEAQEFARGAAKAHENMKLQQSYGYNFPSNINQNSQSGNSVNLNSYGNNISDKQRNKLYSFGSDSNSYNFGNSQTDLVTAPQYNYLNLKDHNVESKIKLPFDHAKALKNIVAIDVSNVVSNSDSQLKDVTGFDGYTNRFNLQNYGKEQMEQNLKQYYKPIADAYYRDKNTGYGYNIKSKPDEISGNERLKQLQLNMAYNEGSFSDSKRYGDSASQTNNYMSQLPSNYQDSVQSPGNIQQMLQRPQNQPSSSDNMANLLKLNDIPHRLTQGLSLDAMRLQNNNFDQGSIPTPLPGKLNQNVDSHQIDVTNSILSKLMMNKQPSFNRPDIDTQTSGLSTINGFRVANPFNVDLKLVAEMLKGKQIDSPHTPSLRDQFHKPTSPLKLDISQLQQLLLKNDQFSSLGSLNDGLSSNLNPYLDIYNNDRYPYQGVKYSRSQEEEESIIPIADASNNHPIGAVMEQDEASEREVSTGSDVLTQDDEVNADHFSEEIPKTQYSGHRAVSERNKHPNSLLSGRHTYQRKYPKSDIAEPYPLLKPPPRPLRMELNRHRNQRRRRISKPKFSRILKTEALFEADSSNDKADTEVDTILRPPPPLAEAKSDKEQVNQ